MSSGPRIECVRGDLTREAVDAIVNAANESLRGGGGVDGAIHRAAGPGLLEECRREHPGGCPTGEVRLTAGHALAAAHVIHAVGPIYAGGSSGEADLLASCFRNAVELAARQGFRSVSFPAISCGVYGYPHAEAAEVSLRALIDALDGRELPERVRVVLFSDELQRVFQDALERLAPTR